MSGPVNETAVNIKPYGTAEYWNGCKYRRAASIVQLPQEVVQRLIDALGVRKPDGDADTALFYQRLEPIAEGVVAKLVELKEEGAIANHCRKTNPKNCAAEVSGIMAAGFREDEDSPVKSMVPVHLGCDVALVNTTVSNLASSAGIAVENASPEVHLDMGCHLQLGATAELAGRLMLEQVELLEAQATTPA